MLNHTLNDTTTIQGQSIATVIADTVYKGSRITTLELVYPRYIHSEFMTHRMFSRNASSSRAIPIEKVANEVLTDPVGFDYVGFNQSGMVAAEELPEDLKEDFLAEWKLWGMQTALKVKLWAKKYNIHKQTLNRALEPWSRIKVLVTATEWDNFFKLRLAPDAQPEIQNLAKAMKSAMDASTPVESKMHLPYVDMTDREPEYTDMYHSVARCARVSYNNNGGTTSTLEEDKKLFERLQNNGHWSPFEHIAEYWGGDEMYANFHNWCSLRNVYENMSNEEKVVDFIHRIFRDS